MLGEMSKLMATCSTELFCNGRLWGAGVKIDLGIISIAPEVAFFAPNTQSLRLPSR
jgi:hypothetical protein